MKKNTSISYRIALIIIAVAGVAIMGYLVSLHYSETESAFCNLGEGLSCDIVNQSIYAKVFGIPVSILGLLYFLGVLTLGIFKYTPGSLKTIAFFSIVFLGPSLYLTGIELFVIENICVFCELSKVLIIAIIAISLLALRPKKLASKAVATAIVLAILLGLITYWNHSRVVPSGKYDQFAQCLYDKGFRMYGSLGCSFCAKQRALFGDSVEYIKEIECDPRFPDAKTDLCVAKNITHTPTWIHEDKDGNNITKFPAGVMSLKDLNKTSDCELPKE